MKKVIIAVVMMFVCGVAFAGPMNQVAGTPNIAGIKAVTQVAKTQATTYQIPFVSTAQKADGSGPVDVVTYQNVTEAQLNQIVTNGTNQIANIQKTVDSAKAELAQIATVKAQQ